MASTSKFTYADLQNPLFVHPSDGPTSISVSKLQGSGDYRSWRRSLESQLASKRKLGFVLGIVRRSTTDEYEGIQWDTCNNLVISWLHNNVCESIKKSILFVSSASEIWARLEKRFLLTNRSRKYKLIRDLFGLKQNGLSVSEYFTALSMLWEEIDAINVLPTVTSKSDDVTTLLKAIDTLKEESKLFKFLNGLDDMYGPQRSQLLMSIPLPTIEMACSALQQEESQRDILHHVLTQTGDISAMYSK